MATIAHVATGLAAGRLLLSDKHRPGVQSPRPLAMVILSLLSIAPDIDVVAFRQVGYSLFSALRASGRHAFADLRSDGGRARGRGGAPTVG